MHIPTNSQLSVCFGLFKDSTHNVQQYRWCSYQYSFQVPSSPHFQSRTHSHHSVVALPVPSLCWCGSTLTTTMLDCNKCQIHLVILQAECLVWALKGITESTKSEQSQSDCNNQPKRLSEEEKPYHASCESLTHFGDLESNSVLWQKRFIKGRAAFSIAFMVRIKPKYLR